MYNNTLSLRFDFIKFLVLFLRVHSHPMYYEVCYNITDHHQVTAHWPTNCFSNEQPVHNRLTEHRPTDHCTADWTNIISQNVIQQTHRTSTHWLMHKKTTYYRPLIQRTPIYWQSKWLADRMNYVIFSSEFKCVIITNKYGFISFFWLPDDSALLSYFTFNVKSKHHLTLMNNFFKKKVLIKCLCPNFLVNVLLLCCFLIGVRPWRCCCHRIK